MQIENLPKQQRLNRRHFLALGVASLTALALEGILAKPSQAAALSGLETNQSGTASTTSVRLTGLTHAWQTLNNCGPAILAMNLSYYGETQDQHTIAQTLRPTLNDQNVRPDELAGYALTQGHQATLRINGNAASYYTELVALIDANLTVATGIKEFYYWKALALVSLGNPAQARQAIQQALAIKPDDQQALAVLKQSLLS